MIIIIFYLCNNECYIITIIIITYTKMYFNYVCFTNLDYYHAEIIKKQIRSII